MHALKYDAATALSNNRCGLKCGKFIRGDAV